jgi:hypothetical protein
MTRDLATEILGYLHEHGQSTALQIATGIEARGSDVAEVCRADERIAGPTPGERGRLYYWVAPVSPGAAQPVTGHNARVLDWLSDGEPHHHLDGYRLGVVLHSRISDLRKRGYVIRQWSEAHPNGRRYWYQLIASPSEPLGGGEVADSGSTSLGEADVPAASSPPSGSVLDGGLIPGVSPVCHAGAHDDGATGKGQAASIEPLQMTFDEVAA